MTLGGIFTEKYVFVQHLTKPTVSNLPCSLIHEQTTKQGQISPTPEKVSSTYLNAREVVYVLLYTIYIYVFQQKMLKHIKDMYFPHHSLGFRVYGLGYKEKP